MDAQTLSAAMGCSLTKATQYVAVFNEALLAANCTTVNRVAMFCAQVGTESAGLVYMEEIADGSEYNGRSDLGNTQPGDGPRYKGSGPIQLTGRSNFGAFSRWTFGRGLVPTATYFVDHPDLVRSNPRWGFLAASWYWTVARNMNGYADRGDIVGASYAVNGGDHGLSDRTRRWNLCRRMGNALLPTTGGPLMALSDSEQTELLAKVRDIFRQLAGPNWTGWEQGGGRTLYDLTAATAAKEGVPNTRDTKAPK